MIYLEHPWADSGLPRPRAVAVTADDVGWLRRQLDRELTVLFPDANVAWDGGGPADVHLLAYRATTHDDDYVTQWVATHTRHARLGVAVYCIDQRHFEVVPRSRAGAWVRRRRLVASVLPFASQRPRVFDLLCARWS
jgi:hypothetical protein